jgi:hypothetical protein
LTRQDSYTGVIIVRLVVMAAVPISSTEKISPTLIRVLVLLGLSVFITTASTYLLRRRC